MARTVGALLLLLLAIGILLLAFARALGVGVVFRDAWRASEWVVVQGTVAWVDVSQRRSRRGTTYLAVGEYRYAFAGTEHTSLRLGLAPGDEGDWMSEWHQEIATFLSSAKGGERTIAVYVNPEKPHQSVVDREIRWGWVANRLFQVFVLAMAGVAVWKMALQPEPGEA